MPATVTSLVVTGATVAATLATTLWLLWLEDAAPIATLEMEVPVVP